jgi:hypothetical protein
VGFAICPKIPLNSFWVNLYVYGFTIIKKTRVVHSVYRHLSEEVGSLQGVVAIIYVIYRYFSNILKLFMTANVYRNLNM